VCYYEHMMNNFQFLKINNNISFGKIIDYFLKHNFNP
jgi:hypothetical protein